VELTIVHRRGNVPQVGTLATSRSMDPFLINPGMRLMGSPDGGQDVGWASRRMGRAGSSDMSGLLAFGVVFESFPDGLRSEQ
jgi:hypothetical protein